MRVSRVLPKQKFDFRLSKHLLLDLLHRNDVVFFGQANQDLGLFGQVFQPEFAVVPGKMAPQIVFDKYLVGHHPDFYGHFVGTKSIALVQEILHDVRFAQANGHGIHEDDLSYPMVVFAVNQPRDGTRSKGMPDHAYVLHRTQVAIHRLPHPVHRIVLLRWVSAKHTEGNIGILEKEERASVASQIEKHWEIKCQTTGCNTVQKQEGELAVAVYVFAHTFWWSIKILESTRSFASIETSRSQEQAGHEFDQREKAINNEGPILWIQRIQ
mmetsp:Transcript_22148/g.49509  ORF Transcript_22148/g.49509 Transcript_22148/m.49509 type:complete len:269 (-) Transcript_22148:657-1463(-)